MLWEHPLALWHCHCKVWHFLKSSFNLLAIQSRGVYLCVSTCKSAADDPAWVCSSVVTCAGTSRRLRLLRWNLLWSWKLSLSYLAASSLEARGGMCESPQQHGYTFESLGQHEASPRGYRQWSVRLCSPTRFLLYVPSFLSSPLLPCLTVWLRCHSMSYTDRNRTKKQGRKQVERSLLRRHRSPSPLLWLVSVCSFLLLHVLKWLKLPPSLKWRDTPSAILILDNKVFPSGTGVPQ